jgi:hypothetical protein
MTTEELLAKIDILEQQNKQLLGALISAKEDICRLCIVINPHHKTCIGCDDMQYYIKLIESTTGKKPEEL